MNDLPVTDMPPSVSHLVQTGDGQPVAPDVAELHASNFACDIVPFVPIFTGWLKRSNSANDASFGLKFEDDPILHCPFVSDIAKQSASSALCSSHKATCCKLLGAYVLKINHNCVFTASDALMQFANIHDQGMEDNFPITFALEEKLKASDVCKCINESGLFATNTKWDENEDIEEDEDFMNWAANCTAYLNSLQAQIQTHLCQTEDDMEILVPTLDVQSLRAISKLCHPNLSFDTELLPSDLLKFTIDAIRSSATTSEEQALDSSLLVKSSRNLQYGTNCNKEKPNS